MGLKDILVYVDNSPHCGSRLDVAIGLAQAHNAHLTGVHVIYRAQLPSYIVAQIGPEIRQVQSDALKKMAVKLEKLFHDKTSGTGINTEWRCVEDGDFVETLAMHSRYSDLVVLGQRDPEGDDLASASDMPDRLVLSLGRPVLVVPYMGKYPKIGERILIAWDASRLATRAVHDALPFLIAAKQVTVLAIDPRGGPEGHGDVAGADLCLHLSRHGVKAEAQRVFTEGGMDIGDMLLSRAADDAVDMIVMGAYGHRRLRELVLGGVTRHMLSHMTVPVLMSH